MTKTLEVIDPRAAPPVWAALRNEAEHTASYQLAHKLGDQELRAMSLRELAIQAYRAAPELVVTAEADLKAVYERDPACKGYVQPFLFFKGFQALQTQRIAHWLWGQGRETMAFYLQSRMSEIFQVDIHPATAAASCWAPAPRCWGTSRSATMRRSPPAPSS